MNLDEERRRILDAHEALVAGGRLQPLGRDSDDTRLWMDWELTSLIENRFFQHLDPMAFSPELRACWEARAVRKDARWVSPHEYAWYAVPYWIVAGGERAGTVVLSTSHIGPHLIDVSSLYILPQHRGKHLASGLLRSTYEAVRAHRSLGIRIATDWTWQPAVRLCIGLSMWIANWKHSLVFMMRDDLPEYRIEIEGNRARFGIVHDGDVQHLVRASRRDKRLGWTELPPMKQLRWDSEVCLLGPGTFAIGLAAAGFPLIRSDRRWAERYQSSDGGEPEGLAYRIEVFEACAREDGFEVRTPRIPGLSYRDLNQIT